MSECLRLHTADLRRLVKARPNQRKKIISLANKELVRCIIECAQNTLQGNVPLNPKQTRRLSKYKRVLRNLSKPGGSWVKKRKQIRQKGGFLVPLLAPIIGSLLSEILLKQ